MRGGAQEMAATIIRGPEEGNWAPGYYYVLFEDPDGIRLEVCFVPGAPVCWPRERCSILPRAISELRPRGEIAVRPLAERDSR